MKFLSLPNRKDFQKEHSTKTSRVEKAHEDAFEKELEDSIHKRKSKEKTKIKKETQKNIL